MKRAMCVLVIAAIGAPPAARAGNAEIGRQLAERRCAPCHVVDRSVGNVVSDAPPFATIAREFPPDALMVVVRGPHERMNFRPTQSEAEDIAEYIRALAR